VLTLFGLVFGVIACMSSPLWWCVGVDAMDWIAGRLDVFPLGWLVSVIFCHWKTINANDERFALAA
jgi:hypothetical protein